MSIILQPQNIFLILRGLHRVAHNLLKDLKLFVSLITCFKWLHLCTHFTVTRKVVVTAFGPSEANIWSVQLFFRPRPLHMNLMMDSRIPKV